MSNNNLNSLNLNNINKSSNSNNSNSNIDDSIVINNPEIESFKIKEKNMETKEKTLSKNEIPQRKNNYFYND